MTEIRLLKCKCGATPELAGWHRGVDTGYQARCRCGERGWVRTCHLEAADAWNLERKRQMVTGGAL